MNSNFLTEDFLLSTPVARRLYDGYARDAEIIDYHCHIDPADLAADRRFENLTQVWIANDPYKHRAMRIAGVPESHITGPASDRQKFDAWAATVPKLLGNALHHWTALELDRYFGIATALAPDTADRIWDEANAHLQETGWSARALLTQRRVACLCTSDRLLDDLAAHRRLAESGWPVSVLPSLRADDALAVDSDGYGAWVAKLGEAAGVAVRDFDSFRTAIVRRLDHFGGHGCRLADHALDAFAYLGVPGRDTAALFERRLGGEPVGDAEQIRLQSGILRFLGNEYARRGWVLQLHLGALRHTSTRLRRLAGPAGGYASLGQATDVAALCRFLDDLEQGDALPTTVLYPLNPGDFAVLANLEGSFTADGVPGRVQLGPAWWFNDHAWGIRAQLDATANYGLLSAFIGMTTDSRSLLSMVRHEYFRRTLCAWLGERTASGIFPEDEQALGALVRDVAGANARRVLNLRTFPR